MSASIAVNWTLALFQVCSTESACRLLVAVPGFIVVLPEETVPLTINPVNVPKLVTFG